MRPENGQEDPIDIALSRIGAFDLQTVRLHEDDTLTERNFEYADLLREGLGRRVAAVVEKDGSPLLYVARVDAGEPDLGPRLARLLGNRAETAALLAVSGVIDDTGLKASIWPCTFKEASPKHLNLAQAVDAQSVLGDLQVGLWDQAGSWQEQELRKLLVNSVSTVTERFRLATGPAANDKGEDLEALALVGRALFTRFLIDRGILSGVTAPELWAALGNDGAAAFAGPNEAARTCEWLDITFNGEFMPLPAPDGYLAYFSRLQTSAPGALDPLGWILHRTNAGGQLPLWECLDFSHIPAGTLSEVYEDFAHRKAKAKAKKDSIHFTPRHIVRMMVRQVFAGLPQGTAASARILDPATGAAVFLSMAYRELARQHALQNGAWPDTEQLRRMLYGQLRGLDINQAALNLAALTLYLTAIELDANPVPPEKLKFKRPLLETVLHNVSNVETPSSKGLGSITSGSSIGADFDIVIGNPPWTSLSGSVIDTVATQLATRCILDRIPESGLKYAHPDKVPDLAFVWKATEWARQDGIISYIVHQRLLVKQSPKWRSARRALFSCVEISGVLNAGELADHDRLIWPGIESPFCVLFARNRTPEPNHRIQVMTLAVEPSLQSRRQIRLDPMATASFLASDFDEEPSGIVARTKGCVLDHALLKRWRARMTTSVEQRARTNTVRRLALTTIGNCLAEIGTGQPKRGFKTADQGTIQPAWFDGLSADTKEISAKDAEMVGGVDVATLKQSFTPRPLKSFPELHWFMPPVLLLRESPGERLEPARALLLTDAAATCLPVMYPFTWLGTPLTNTPSAIGFAKYIALWMNSSVFSYFQTLTSTRFAFGRKVVNSTEILDTPITHMQLALDKGLTEQREIDDLFERLNCPGPALMRDIDAWVCKIAGIDAGEQQLILDTLSVAYPIGDSRQSGKTWVSPSQLKAYYAELRSCLGEAQDVINITSLRILTSDDAPGGWRFFSWRVNHRLAVHVNPDCAPLNDLSEESLLQLVRSRYPLGAVWAATRDGELVFGQMALARLWLPSRATLVAQQMVAWVDQLSA